MPKDRPTRNPRMSPAGLSPEELSRHRSQSASPGTACQPRHGSAERCSFVTSRGGVEHCADPPYLAEFCRFHHDCLLRREISPLGRILDSVRDQERRREINGHGIQSLERDRLPADPLTGGEQEGRS